MSVAVLLKPEDKLKPQPAPLLAGGREVVVLKFGSSVLHGPEDTPNAASEIYGHVRQGRRVVAVVSAFGGETDRLLGHARELGLPHENLLAPAYVVQGEEQAAALTALACDRVGLDAVSLTVRELGLVAEGEPEHAHPRSLDDARLRRALENHEVVVVPGFGAVTGEGKVVLLGRGGTDLTAAFLAAELGLKKVRLVKDVDGLYDRDPNNADGALRYDRASWETARRLGGSLVQRDAIDLGQARGVEIEVAALGRAAATVVGDAEDAPHPAKPYQPVRVAVAGAGVVGGGLLKRLLNDPRFEVVRVLVRDPKKPRDFACPPELFTDAQDDLLASKPHVVLEAMSEGQAGHDLIRAALDKGLDVVSANKQAISIDPAGLNDLAWGTGARLAYSAAVGGGSPMIETLRLARAAGPVAGFKAVLNGTVNFMLERLAEGDAFDDALSAARAAGFAEEDPSSDLEGLDSAAKVRLLAYEAFGEAPDDLPLQALSPDAPLGRRGVRQIGACQAKGGRLEARVALESGLDPVFQNLKGERNALKVVGHDGRVWTCKGRGAGRWATAESVLADLSDIVRIRQGL